MTREITHLLFKIYASGLTVLTVMGLFVTPAIIFTDRKWPAKAMKSIIGALVLLTAVGMLSAIVELWL